jgi:hypothetical protein
MAWPLISGNVPDSLLPTGTQSMEDGGSGGGGGKAGSKIGNQSTGEVAAYGVQCETWLVTEYCDRWEDQGAYLTCYNPVCAPGQTADGSLQAYACVDGCLKETKKVGEIPSCAFSQLQLVGTVCLPSLSLCTNARYIHTYMYVFGTVHI